MFSVTDAAGRRLLDLLEGVRPKADQTLRLTLKTPERLGLALDSERERDQVVLASGRPVLLIEPELAEQLSGVMLVVEEGIDGPRLGLQASSLEEARSEPEARPQ